MKEKYCESCLMPFSKDEGVRESDKYCSLCFNHNELCYQGSDVKEFKKRAYTSMRSKGIGAVKATFFTWMIGFAPRWKK
jgi:hypothetical protein